MSAIDRPGDLARPRGAWSLAPVAGDRPDALLDDDDASGRRILVPTGPCDRYFDYCLQPYAPVADPRGKLRGESLLWQSLAVAGVPVADDRPLHAIQRAAGTPSTMACGSPNGHGWRVSM